MTFDEFRADLLTFIDESTVNLGRKGTKPRQIFMDTVAAKFDTFINGTSVQTEDESVPNPMNGSVLCIKPHDPRRVLDVGKGVHGMTPSESMRADEQLNRSPYAGKQGESKNE